MPSKQGVRNVIKDFNVGDSVAIVPKGNFRDIPHPRYRGKVGRVVEKRGAAYVVELNVMNAKRQLVVAAAHLEKA
jgi:large subunit ribosomal protein L21e